MADIDPTPTSVPGGEKIAWSTLTSSNADGAAYSPNGTVAAIAAVQVTGTFDSATLVLQGSNDGTTWVTLKDTLGSSISFATAGYAELSTAMAYIRPSTSGGGGSQDLDCIIVARG